MPQASQLMFHASSRMRQMRHGRSATPAGTPPVPSLATPSDDLDGHGGKNRVFSTSATLTRRSAPEPRPEVRSLPPGPRRGESRKSPPPPRWQFEVVGGCGERQRRRLGVVRPYPLAHPERHEEHHREVDQQWQCDAQHIEGKLDDGLALEREHHDDGEQQRHQRDRPDARREVVFVPVATARGDQQLAVANPAANGIPSRWPRWWRSDDRNVDARAVQPSFSATSRRRTTRRPRRTGSGRSS